MRLNKKVKSPFTSIILDRIKKGKNAIIIVTGETGSGKSYGSIELSHKLDKSFNATRIAFSAYSFMQTVNRGLKKGKAMVIDEAGVVINARSFATQINKLISFVNQTYRKKQYITFFCVPDLSFIDVHIRKLAHFVLEAQGYNQSTMLSKFKVLRISTSQRTGKIYYPHPIITMGEQQYKLNFIYVKYPPAKIVKEYEKNKDEFIAELNKSVLKKLLFANKKEETITPSEKEIMKLRQNKYSVKEIAEKMGYSGVQPVYYHINKINKIMGTRLTTKDNKK